MDRRHFRHQNGEVLLHVFGEGGFRIENGFSLCVFIHSFFDGGLQRTKADADGTQVQTLVDLEAGVEAVSLVHDFLYLVGDYSVQAAAEGVELHQFQIAVAGDVVGCFIQTAVPGPLVHDPEGGELAAHHGYAVFGKHGHAQLVDEVGDGVVHRGVHVVGAAGQYDADEVLFIDFFQNPFRFPVQVLAVFFFRRLPGVNGRFDVAARNA